MSGFVPPTIELFKSAIELTLYVLVTSSSAPLRREHSVAEGSPA
jgi:hypothetical protein